MEFCDNRRQLFQAYFRNFTIEQLDRPWRAFTGGWHNDIAARKLGINASFISGDYCYVLVRVSRYRDSAKLKKPIPPNQVLENDITARIRNVTPGDTTGTVQFMNRYGTHYVNSYVTGNSLYQVFKHCFLAKILKILINLFPGICLYKEKLSATKRTVKNQRCISTFERRSLQLFCTMVC